MKQCEIQAGKHQYLIQTPVAGEFTAGGIAVPEVARKSNQKDYSHGIVVSAGPGADQSMVGRMAWFDKDNAMGVVESVDADGSVDGQTFLAVPEEMVIGSRELSNAGRKRILRSEAIPIDREAEKEKRIRRETA